MAHFFGRFLAAAKSTTTQVAKFLLEELLGSKKPRGERLGASVFLG
jgi:hypothetical protein